MSDLISRQDVIDEIEYELEMINSALDSITLDFNARERLRQRRGEAREILNSIQQLPSVQPEVRTQMSSADCISRQSAIDALDDIESEVSDGFGFQYEKWRKHFADLPSAQLEVNCSEFPNNSDTISRQGAIELAMQYCPDDDGTCSKADKDIRDLLDELENLPSVQPERKNKQEVEKKLHDMFDFIWDTELNLPILQDTVGELIEDVLEVFDIVQPERKTGWWETVKHKTVEHAEVVNDGDTVRCSVCKHAEKGWNAEMNYCPNCGAKMEDWVFETNETNRCRCIKNEIKRF